MAAIAASSISTPGKITLELPGSSRWDTITARRDSRATSLSEAPDTAVRVSRDAQRIKARIWKAGRMSPRKWGERLEQNDMGAIRPPIVVIHSSADIRPGAAPKADRRQKHDGD